MNLKHTLQSGRSMVEMLGTLAIIGVCDVEAQNGQKCTPTSYCQSGKCSSYCQWTGCMRVYNNKVGEIINNQLNARRALSPRIVCHNPNE